MIKNTNMIKTTVYLGRNQVVELKQYACKMELSYASLLRIAVGDYLKKLDRRK